ncbi:MAG: thioredoxin family protein [Acidobacteriota bacterium]|nr:thioredoxin family protein [Acidobacteriota bacterium]
MALTDQRAIPVSLIAVAAALLLLRIASALWPVHEERPGKAGDLVHWLTIEEGAQLARSTGKPVLFDFTAESCQPCHMLDEQVFHDAKMAAAINQRFVPVRVVDRRQEEGANPRNVAELQRRFAVRAFPTVIFAGGDGSERARMEGFRGVEEFERVMEQTR